MCAVPNMAVFWSSLISLFAGMLLTYFLNDFEIYYYYYYYYHHHHHHPNPHHHYSDAVTARCKAWRCGHSLARITGSNPAGGMDVCHL